MATFRYELPKKPEGSQWERLSDEAMRALAGAAMGPSDAGELLDNYIFSLEALAPGVLRWASAELNGDFANGALSSWERYESSLAIAVPNGLDELIQTNPNLISTLNRLYEAKQALESSGEITPDGLNISDTMHLVLIPWQSIRNHLTDFSEWIGTLRDCQNIATGKDFISSGLLTTIKSNFPLYRDADNPEHLLTPTEYLDKQIDKDGPWGVMLAQTSSESGISQVMGESPDEMTAEGTKHLELAGHHIDAMGIFEWIALTMQMDPSQLSTADYSWLLANRMVGLDVDMQSVPCGDWGAESVNIRLWVAHLTGDSTLVRVAVI